MAPKPHNITLSKSYLRTFVLWYEGRLISVTFSITKVFVNLYEGNSYLRTFVPSYLRIRKAKYEGKKIQKYANNQTSEGCYQKTHLYC